MMIRLLRHAAQTTLMFGLLDYPAPGQVVACPVLFLDGR